MTEPIKFCDNCYLWEVLNSRQLCEQGTCYLDKNNPVPKSRYDTCDNWSEVGEGRVLE